MAQPTPGQSEAVAITILYTNWRGETALRRIVPWRALDLPVLWFGSTEWHPEPQWFLSAIDVEKDVHRDWALSGIRAWGEAAIRDAEMLAGDVDVMRKGLRLAEQAIACPDVLSRIRSALSSEGKCPGAVLWEAGLARDAAYAKAEGR